MGVAAPRAEMLALPREVIRSKKTATCPSFEDMRGEHRQNR
jgi:hypothetical protein